MLGRTESRGGEGGAFDRWKTGGRSSNQACSDPTTTAVAGTAVISAAPPAAALGVTATASNSGTSSPPSLRALTSSAISPCTSA